LNVPAFGVVVGADADPLAEAVTASLSSRGVDTRRIDASQLALEALELDRDGATLGGRTIDAAVFLAEPTASFGGDFAREDAEFCDAEVRATWLALLNLPSIATVTRWTAEEWTSLGEWAIWRRRLLADGVACTALAFGMDPADGGTRWVPFSSSETHSLPGPAGRRMLVPPQTSAQPAGTSIWCCGRVVAGTDSQTVHRCGQVLERYGTRLASIVLDQDGAVFACASRLQVVDEPTVISIAESVADQLHADLSGRRS
jgi:hypothetical protein